MIYQRDPEPLELKLGQRFLQEQPAASPPVGWPIPPLKYNGYGHGV